MGRFTSISHPPSPLLQGEHSARCTGVRNGKRGVAALFTRWNLSRQWSGLLERERLTHQRDGPGPILSANLQTVVLGPHIHRTALREHTAFGKEVRVGIFPRE